MRDRSGPQQGPIISELAEIENSGLPDRSVGAILIEVGRLSETNARRIAHFQIGRCIRFGEAAVEMGLLTHADVDFALARQFEYPYLLRGESMISEEIVAAYEPFTRQVEALRALRTQLMIRHCDPGEDRTLAITSAQRGDGRSYLAANLATVFSQQGERTLLIDADLRSPRQHLLFGMDNRLGLSAVLCGRMGIEAIQRVPALLDLSVLPAGALPPNPLELVGRPRFGQFLQQVSRLYDVILLDCPAGCDSADAQAIAVRAGAAVVVTRQNVSQVNAVQALIDSLRQARVNLVGTVFNTF